jgi:hypothetical protein
MIENPKETHSLFNLSIYTQAFCHILPVSKEKREPTQLLFIQHFIITYSKILISQINPHQKAKIIWVAPLNGRKESKFSFLILGLSSLK